MRHPNIPKQISGNYQDIVKMQCSNTLLEASNNFKLLHKRLINVNNWHSLSTKVKSNYQLIDSRTAEFTEDLKIGNYLRIDIPGPGSPIGNGYDWTKIVDIESELENDDSPFFSFTVKPSPSPNSERENIAHFYDNNSSNTFIIRKIGTCIYAEIHGRNERENTSNVPILDKVRNKAVALGGKIGLSDLNWMGLTEALLETF